MDPRYVIIAAMRASLCLALPFLAGCSYSLEGDLADARAQIVDLEHKLPPECPLWISEGPDRFDAFIVDYDPGVPDFLYYHLLRRIDALSDAELEHLLQGDFDREACLRDPALYRGKFWRVHGVIADLHAEPVEDPRQPVRLAHAGVCFDAATRPILFHVTRKPEVLTLRQDVVETDALFVKWIEYKSRSGQTVVAPLFIGKTLRRYL